MARLEQAPHDADRQAALRVALKDLLADDPALREEFAGLLKDLPEAAIDQRLVQTGDHNHAAQIAGSNNKTTIN